VISFIVKQDLVLVRQEVDALAVEYDNIGGLMPSRDQRTLDMVVSKMRTVGRAAYSNFAQGQ